MCSIRNITMHVVALSAEAGVHKTRDDGAHMRVNFDCVVLVINMHICKSGTT